MGAPTTIFPTDTLKISIFKREQVRLLPVFNYFFLGQESGLVSFTRSPVENILSFIWRFTKSNRRLDDCGIALFFHMWLCQMLCMMSGIMLTFTRWQAGKTVQTPPEAGQWCWYWIMYYWPITTCAPVLSSPDSLMPRTMPNRYCMFSGK